MRKVFVIVHHGILTRRNGTYANVSCEAISLHLVPMCSKWNDTHSSVFSFLIPSHSLSFFCLTPFWVNHLTEGEHEDVRNQDRRILIFSGGKHAVSSRSSRAAVRALHLHEILVSGLAELDEVGLDAVHPLVDLSVVCRLFLQIFLQSAFAVYDFTYPRFQLFVVPHDPEKKNRFLIIETDFVWM